MVDRFSGDPRDLFLDLLLRDAPLGDIEMFRNALERGLAESALRQSEERFPLAVRVTHEAYRADQVVPTIAWWIKHIHRQDGERVVAGLRAGLIDRAGKWTLSNAVMRMFVQAFMPSRDPERASRWRAWHQNGIVTPLDAWAGERALRGETGCPALDMLYRRDDGTEIWTPVRSTPGCDRGGTSAGAICTVEDSGERKRADEALKEREQRLQLALAGGQIGTWDFDVHSDEATWDAKAFALLGYDDMSIRPSLSAFYAQVHPEDRLRVKQAVHHAVTVGGEFEQEFRIVRPDGQAPWIVSKGVVLPDQPGRARRMTGISYDITARKLMEEQLRSYARELEGRVEERTVDLMQFQARLRALATELNLAEQRERKRMAGELHDHLQQLLVLGKLKLSQGRRLPHVDPACAALIQQVEAVLSEALQYTRTLVARLSPPALRDHGLAAGLKWLAEYMTKHDMAVTVLVPDEDNPALPEDQALLLFQSVRELLMNSWKHAGTGHATVTMAWKADILRLEVRDHGKGFELAAAETPTELSSKFGLFSISERMQALGGSLHIESCSGAGTTCTLELPFVEPPREVSTTRPSADDSTGEKNLCRRGRKIRTVLADDHAMIRQGLRSVLDRYADVDIVAEAANGEEAIHAVEQCHPAVVVMDIHMPKMNGLEATARLKARYPDLHIIGLSCNVTEEAREAMFQAGALVLLAKESPVEQLYAAVRRAVILKGAA